jgi:hypothetical protein
MSLAGQPQSFIASRFVGDAEFFDDFFEGGNGSGGGKFELTANEGAWLLSGNTPTAIVMDDAPNGVVRLSMASSDNDRVSAQLNGEAFKPAAARQIYLEFRIRLRSDTAADTLVQTDFFVGLASTDTDILTGVTNSIGFRSSGTNGEGGGNANINCVVEDNSTETTADSGVDFANDTFVNLGVLINGVDEVMFYINGQFKKRITTNIPGGDPLTLSMEVRRSGAGAANLAIELDYIYARQTR